MITIGIDPGLKGGIVALTGQNEIFDYEPMFLSPGDKDVDSGAIVAFLERIKRDSGDDITVYLEAAQVRHTMGATASMTVGKNYGRLLACLEIGKYRHIIVAASKWTKFAHSGVDTRLEAKDKSMVAFKRLFPEVNFILHRCRKPHDGLVDALLIAYYGANSKRK